MLPKCALRLMFDAMKIPLPFSFKISRKSFSSDIVPVIIFQNFKMFCRFGKISGMIYITPQNVMKSTQNVIKYSTQNVITFQRKM